MSQSKRLIAGLSIIVYAIDPVVAAANETQTFAYDEFGRLIDVSYSGTVNNGQKHSICYDSTDNRTRYRSDPAGAGAVCPTPVPVPVGAPPPPPPPAPNNPPIANTDVVNVPQCATVLANLVVNDTDPDGHALTIVSVGTSNVADVYIYDSQRISVTGYPPNPYNHGWITYTISDGHGGSATGSIHIIVGGGGACQ